MFVPLENLANTYEHSNHPEVESVRQQQFLAAIAVALMWFRLFKWMRLFRALSYYTRLITETFWDITSFAILNVMAISANANILFILNEQRIYEGTTLLFGSKIGNSLGDALINTYMLTLGEFEYDGFEGVNN